MPMFSRYQKLITAGISACGGGLLIYYGINYYSKKPLWTSAHASWTTNFTPSCQWDSNWDRRDPASAVKPSKGPEDDNRYNREIEALKPKATRHIILIRHGQYNLNGKTDKERTLTKLGQEQAQLTGQRLKELSYDYSGIIVSTMTRANETASFIQQYFPTVPTHHCSLLVEGAPIPPEPPVGHWKPEAYQFYQDGPRIEAAFRKYFHRADVSQTSDSYEIVVCHANVIRYFVCRALQFPSEAWLRMSLNHASITWLTIAPNGRVKLASYSDTGHMPLKAISN